MHISDTSKGQDGQGHRDGAATVVTHDGHNMVIVSRVVSRIVGMEHGRVSKGDHVGVSRVHKGHKRRGVLGHVDNGSGNHIAVIGRSVSHEREQGAIVVRVVGRPVGSVGEEVGEEKRGHGELAQPWSHGV